MQLLAVEVAGALFGAVLLVRREERVEREEGGLRVINAHRCSGSFAVAQHRVQVQRPEADVGLADFAHIGEELVLVDVGEDVLGLDRFQTGEEELCDELETYSDLRCIRIVSICSTIYHSPR